MFKLARMGLASRDRAYRNIYASFYLSANPCVAPPDSIVLIRTSAVGRPGVAYARFRGWPVARSEAHFPVLGILGNQDAHTKQSKVVSHTKYHTTFPPPPTDTRYPNFVPISAEISFRADFEAMLSRLERF